MAQAAPTAAPTGISPDVVARDVRGGYGIEQQSPGYNAIGDLVSMAAIPKTLGNPFSSTGKLGLVSALMDPVSLKGINVLAPQVLGTMWGQRALTSALEDEAEAIAVATKSMPHVQDLAYEHKMSSQRDPKFDFQNYNVSAIRDKISTVTQPLTTQLFNAVRGALAPQAAPAASPRAGGVLGMPDQQLSGALVDAYKISDPFVGGRGGGNPPGTETSTGNYAGRAMGDMMGGWSADYGGGGWGGGWGGDVSGKDSSGHGLG
jgi:hypothetical protein